MFILGTKCTSNKENVRLKYIIYPIWLPKTKIISCSNPLYFMPCKSQMCVEHYDMISQGREILLFQRYPLIFKRQML